MKLGSPWALSAKRPMMSLFNLRRRDLTAAGPV